MKLSNLKIKDNQGRLTPGAFDKTVQLVEPSTAVVMIIDDDHSGMFVFENDEKSVVESDRSVHVKVLRTSGARGRVRVPYATEDETAINGKDYIGNTGEIIFENNENEYVLIRSSETHVDRHVLTLPTKNARIGSCSVILLKAFLFHYFHT